LIGVRSRTHRYQGEAENAEKDPDGLQPTSILRGRWPNDEKYHPGTEEGYRDVSISDITRYVKRPNQDSDYEIDNEPC
jgi:hypothetical protein